MCEVFKENIIAKNKYIVNKHNIILKYTYIFCKHIQVLNTKISI